MSAAAAAKRALASLLRYVERESARRVAGMLRLHDGELAALLDLLRHEAVAAS